MFWNRNIWVALPIILESSLADLHPLLLVIMDALPALMVVFSGFELSIQDSSWAQEYLWWALPGTGGSGEGDGGITAACSQSTCDGACPADVPPGMEGGVVALVAVLVLANGMGIAYLRQRRSRVLLLIASIGVDCAHAPEGTRSALINGTPLEDVLKRRVSPWLRRLPALLFCLVMGFITPLYVRARAVGDWIPWLSRLPVLLFGFLVGCATPRFYWRALPWRWDWVHSRVLRTVHEFWARRVNSRAD